VVREEEKARKGVVNQVLTVWGNFWYTKDSTHHPLNAWTVLPDGRRCSKCHCCSLLWASIDIF